MNSFPALFWPTAVMAVVLVGVAKAGFGGGVGVIATPLVALTIPVADAAALMLPILIVADLFTVRAYRTRVDTANLRLMLPSAAAGILLGAIFFDAFSQNERALKIGIGVIALAFVAYQAARTVLLRQISARTPSTAVGILLNVTAGFTSTLAHVGGPPATMYLLPQQLPRSLFVGTLAVFFLVVNLIKLVPYAYLGLLRTGNLAATLILLPFAFVGVRLGVWLNGRFSDTWFNRVIYALLFLTSIQLIMGESLVGALAR